MRSNLGAAFERTNKAGSIALVVLICLFWAHFLRPESLGGRAGYVLVSGQSMEPRYHTGDLVLVHRHASYRVGQVIAYRVPKGDAMAYLRSPIFLALLAACFVFVHVLGRAGKDEQQASAA